MQAGIAVKLSDTPGSIRSFAPAIGTKHRRGAPRLRLQRREDRRAAGEASRIRKGEKGKRGNGVKKKIFYQDRFFSVSPFTHLPISSLFLDVMRLSLSTLVPSSCTIRQQDFSHHPAFSGMVASIAGVRRHITTEQHSNSSDRARSV